MRLLKKTQLVCAVLLLWTVGAYAQNVVKGKVVSAETNQPMVGVSVFVKGDNLRGTSTDASGNYSIKASANEVLVFSFIGCETASEAVNQRTVIDVRLKTQANQLDDVVVMGYSTQTKAELSSSVVTLKGENLTDVTSPDVGNMLQGKAPGVLVYNTSGQPGSQATIRVRGTGSISAASDPLYVVDGIIGGSFNPNDIETLTVLKDAGATALYGSEGAGGVIVITTKSAKTGQKTTVNFKLSAGVKSVLSGRLKMMDSRELYDTQKTFMPEVLFNAQRPESLLGRNFDWTDAIFRTGVVQNYYASVAGSSGKTNYFVSIDHYNEEGTLINTKYARTSARVNLSTELYKSLRMNTRVAYTNSRDYSASAYQTLEFAYGLLPWDNPYNADGSAKDLMHDSSLEWLSQNRYNIFYNEQYNYAKSHGNDLSADLQLIWQIAPWLSFTTSNRFNTANSKYVVYNDPRTVSESETVKGSLSHSLSEGWGISTSNLLKASQSWGSHTLTGLVGYEYGINKEEYTDVEGINMPQGMDAMNATLPYTNGGYDIWGEGYSFFAQAQYSYANKYVMTASFRADASSKFAPKNRTGYFPSVSGSWIISKENWFADSRALRLLKLRASWGQTGNSSIGSYMYLDSYSLSAKYQNNVAAIPVRKANPTLGWETADMTNLGLDVNLWDRLEVTLDLYHIVNKGLLLNVPTAPSTGFFEFTDNAGKVRNRGFEVMVSSTNIRHKNFEWTTSVNLGLNRNKVLTTPTPEGFLQSNTNGSVTQIVKPGHDIYSWYMPKWLGVDPSNGDPVWEKLLYDDKGKVVGSEPTNVYNDAQKQIVGSATPKFSGGFFNNFRLYNFSLNVACNFVYGNKIFNLDRTIMDNDGAFTNYNMVSFDNGLKWKRWEKPGDAATHPKAVSFGNKNSNAVSSRYLEDGSFFRIKNITLAYNFPKKLLSKLRMQGLKVYASVDNLATFTKFSGMDPEIDLQGSSYNLAGMYSSPYPVGRTFMFGVDLTF
ncbi:SusC/RagA family TonB-linked outer membrane protein [Alistipes sp.]|uniref:SusC/RagA family TonB-linked outer membrane protein n=1 Tax=Alistipes sp. TaxID=1872444 RepID=UPI003AB7BE41